ncbi:MAG TPA: hypothetical protein VFB14_27510 [Bryobacteraceae bacterium]|jgi:uncharacterized protein (DUF302 family)|nr:hypothetical protein [Bryobacteraceae bacterium]
MMETQTTTMAFVLDQAFEPALAQIRQAIRQEQLSIAGEVDVAQRVRHTLEIFVPQCRVLLVDSPLLLLETTAIDRASGIFIPLHLVVSSAGSRTLVQMLNLEHIRNSDLPIGIRAPVLDLQRQLARALAKVAQRVHSA